MIGFTVISQASSCANLTLLEIQTCVSDGHGSVPWSMVPRSTQVVGSLEAPSAWIHYCPMAGQENVDSEIFVQGGLGGSAATSRRAPKDCVIPPLIVLVVCATHPLGSGLGRSPPTLCWKIHTHTEGSSHDD